MRLVIIVAVALAELLGSSHSASAQFNSAITYQGRLTEAGQPITDSVDMEFSLFDDAGGDFQIGPTLSNPGVPVQDGLFTIELDFGMGVFTGGERWLEIKVNGQTLSPRQLITTAPMAIYAHSTGLVQDQSLAGTYTNPLSFTNSSNVFGGDGAGLANLNASSISSGIVDDAVISANIPRLNLSNTFIENTIFNGSIGIGTSSPSQNLHIADSLFSTILLDRIGGSQLSLSAQGSIASVGTVNSFPLRFNTNNAVRMTVDTAGNIGIGTVTPDGRFDVRQPNAADIFNLYDGATNVLTVIDGGNVGIGASAPAERLTVGGIVHSSSGGFRFPDGSLQATAASGGGGHWSASGADIFNSNTGYVGIGTSNPNSPLHVNGTSGAAAIYATAGSGVNYGAWIINPSSGGTGVFGQSSVSTLEAYGVHGLAQSNEGRGVFGQATSSSGATYGVYGVSSSSAGAGVLGRASAATGATVGVRGESPSTGGKGILGTATAITGNTIGVHGHAASSNGIGVLGESTAMTGIATAGLFECDSSSGRAVVGIANATTGVTYGGMFSNSSTGGRGVYGWSTAATGSGIGVYGETASPTGYAGYFVGGRSYFNGSVGVGTLSPAADFEIRPPSGNADLLLRRNDSPDGFNLGASGTKLFISSYDGTTFDDHMVVTDSGNVGIGTTNPGAALDVVGTTRTQVLTITGGSDLAEAFHVRAAAGECATSPGSVVVIDPENPGRLMIAREPYDTRVAGIISGANGLSPGMVMSAIGDAHADGDHHVALTGRVWCLCDASQPGSGAIEPGDLLTTSTTPGHAMKAANRDRAYGAVLGKAMTPLAEGERGLVLVLVNLQ